MTASGHYQSGFIATIFPLAVCYQHQYPLFYYLLFFAACMLGVTAPDYLELRKRTKVKKGLLRKERTVIKTRLPHRGITHTMLIWVGIALWGYFKLPQIEPYNHIHIFLYGTLFSYTYGGVIHLLGDLPNKKGIPLFPFGRKYALHLWKSSRYEWFTTLFLGCIVLCLTLLYLGIGMN